MMMIKQGGDLVGFHMSSEKKTMSDLLKYAKYILSESVSKLEEVSVQVCMYACMYLCMYLFFEMGSHSVTQAGVQ